MWCRFPGSDSFHLDSRQMLPKKPLVLSFHGLCYSIVAHHHGQSLFQSAVYVQYYSLRRLQTFGPNPCPGHWLDRTPFYGENNLLKVLVEQTQFHHLSYHAQSLVAMQCTCCDIPLHERPLGTVSWTLCHCLLLFEEEGFVPWHDSCQERCHWNKEVAYSKGCKEFRTSSPSLLEEE